MTIAISAPPALPPVAAPNKPITTTWQSRAITFVAGSPNASLPRFLIGKVGLVFLSVAITIVALASALFTKNAFAPVKQAGKAIAKPRNPKLNETTLKSVEFGMRDLVIGAEMKQWADLKVKFLSSMPKPTKRKEVGRRFTAEEQAGRIQVRDTRQQELVSLRAQYIKEKARIKG
jgi:hypothetical protein